MTKKDYEAAARRYRAKEKRDAAPANTYIPEGGLWTAEERENLTHETEKHGSAVVGDAEALRASDTVAALMKCLEDVLPFAWQAVALGDNMEATKGLNEVENVLEALR